MEGYSEQTGNTAPRVLIVDDNPEIREIIRILLSGEGYELEEAKNGNETLEKAGGILQADASETESNQIGLRSVRKMVEMHGGELYTFVETNVYTVCIAFDMINKYSGEGGEKYRAPGGKSHGQHSFS